MLVLWAKVALAFEGLSLLPMVCFRLSDEGESDEDSNDGGGSSSSSSDPDKPKLVLSSQLKQKIRNTPDVLPRKILEKM